MDYNKLNKSIRLANILHNMLDIEWLKYSMYRLEDPYHEIPALFFRVKTENQNIIELLNDLLNKFRGSRKWCVFKYPFSRKDLFCISIEEYREYCESLFNSGEFIFAKNYFGEKKYYELRELAIKDIDPLCNWVLNGLQSR
jgi:hypothetical protein